MSGDPKKVLFRDDHFVRVWFGGLAWRGSLRVNQDEVLFEGETLARRSQLRGGFIVPDRRGHIRIELVRAFGPRLKLRASSTERARELLHVLGFDAGQSTSSFGVASRLMTTHVAWLWTAIGLAIAGLVHAIHFPYANAIIKGALVASVLVAAVATRTKLTIGADGVYVRDPFGRHFVPFADVAGVGTYLQGVLGREHVGVVLTMRDGAERRLLVGRVDFAGDRAARIAERIREALDHTKDATRDVEPADMAGAMLERGGRPVREWLNALRAIGSGANVDLRTPPVPEQTLWRIVEDPRASQPARASAAVALSGQVDGEGRARLRVAAEATAAPKLRAALEAATTENDAALEAALEEIETERGHAG